jgi:hypothetical protein
MTDRPANPLDKLLGSTGTPPACKVIAEDISVHWYPSGVQPGDHCLCGKTVMKEER